jgi:hypothetical protein
MDHGAVPTFPERAEREFLGDLYGQTKQAWQKFFELDSERQRDRFSGWHHYQRGPRPPGGIAMDITCGIF